MAKAKSPLAQANKARAIKAAARKKEIKAGLSKLKKAGLYTGDVRTAKGNSHQAGLVKRYADVISGKAKAIKTNTNTEIAFRGAGGRGAHGRVVVEIEPGEKIRFNKKTGYIEGKRVAYGVETRRQIIFQKVFDPKKLPKPGKGETFYYQGVFKKSKTATVDSIQRLIELMSGYANAKSENPEVRERFRKFWASHVSVTQVVKSA